jgi:hypothetical protein
MAGPDKLALLHFNIMWWQLNSGHFEFVPWAAEYLSAHLGELPAPMREYYWGNRAIAAFYVGDLATLRIAVSRLPAQGDAGRQAAFMIDLVEGRPDQARVKLASWKPGNPNVLAYTRGLLALASRDWAMAITELERAQATLAPQQRRTADEGENFALIGLAHVEAGEPRLALRPLEHALDITWACCQGFHYFTPIAQLALARALWATGGDRTRARKLADHARDGFARLGPGRERDRLAAIRWLAEHEDHAP